MNIPILTPDQLPDDVRARLHEGELIHYFTYNDATKGGCSSMAAPARWILVTDQRFVFAGPVQKGEGFFATAIQTSGSIPMSKVSYVGLESRDERRSNSFALLRVNSSGGSILLQITTNAQANSIQEVVDSIITREK